MTTKATNNLLEPYETWEEYEALDFLQQKIFRQGWEAAQKAESAITSETEDENLKIWMRGYDAYLDYDELPF